MTVLFANLKGGRWSCWLTAIARKRGSSSTPVREWMMEAVHRYEGTVTQVMGDRIMVLFGAPLAHEDHAVGACCAALRMQEKQEGTGLGLTLCRKFVELHGGRIWITSPVGSGSTST